MINVETRFVAETRCDDGHPTLVFDVVLNGTVFPEAVRLHSKEPGKGDFYFEEPARSLLEADHAALHDAGQQMVDVALQREWQRFKTPAKEPPP